MYVGGTRPSASRSKHDARGPKPKHSRRLPRGHVPLHVDVHAVEEALDGVRGGQEEVGQVEAHGADEEQEAQGLPDAARPSRQSRRAACHGLLKAVSSHV